MAAKSKTKVRVFARHENTGKMLKNVRVITMKKVYVIVATAVFVASLFASFLTVSQVNHAQLDLTSRLQSRSEVLAESLAESIARSYNYGATSDVQKIIDKFTRSNRLAGLSVFDNSGRIVAGSKNMPLPEDVNLITTVMDSDQASGDYVHRSNITYYVLVVPLHKDGSVVGALVVAQNATYIDISKRDIWRRNAIRLLLQILIFAATAFVLVRWFFFHSISKMVES
ncbi:MAG TPA: hypothetical protein VMV42_01740, partial [archaeon]|nr:hypothetical protein [archaeon]